MSNSILNEGVESSHNVVLLHTLPSGVHGARAEDAVYRQYNSCVDFTFKSDQQFVNARRLKRLNLIFERAADRNFVGLREDKLLKILPPGAAFKYGLDPAAIERRCQETSEYYMRMAESGLSSEDEQVDKKRSKKKKRRKKHKKKTSNDHQGVRVLSRGTFLAMFANESNIFINLMAQNEKAHRQNKKKVKKNAAVSTIPKKQVMRPVNGTSRRKTISAISLRNSDSKSRTVTDHDKNSAKLNSKRSSQQKGKRMENVDSSSSQKKKTHRRRKSVHSINSEDSPFLMDVPSQITSPIFESSSSKHSQAALVSDISDSETSFIDRHRNGKHRHYKFNQKSKNPGNATLVSEGSYHQDSHSYDGHPADEAGGHASIVSLSSEESSPKNHQYVQKDVTVISNKEKKARRRQLKYLKHQKRLQEYHHEKMAAEQQIHYIQQQEKLRNYVPSKHHDNEDECVFLSSVVNALKIMFTPKSHRIYVDPCAYVQGTQTPVPYGPNLGHMHNLMGHDLYNVLPANNHRYQ